MKETTLKQKSAEEVLENALWAIHKLAHLPLVRKTDPVQMPAANMEQLMQGIREQATEALIQVRQMKSDLESTRNPVDNLENQSGENWRHDGTPLSSVQESAQESVQESNQEWAQRFRESWCELDNLIADGTGQWPERYLNPKSGPNSSKNPSP